ncbi:MAG: sigma-70 family RNA polymerase sigma factor, partial [Planctomycetales bacterium]|nr:sigma-70 family RNA polymerase sigma factor [Planctomycetales bacterium]
QLYAFVRSRMASDAAAEDALQETWLVAWRSREQFQDGNLRAWLYQIARSRIADRGRRDGKRKETEWSDGMDPAVQESLEDDHLDYLRECLAALPEPFAGIIRLFLDDASHQDISERLEIPMGTVASRINRAKKALRDCVEGKLK